MMPALASAVAVSVRSVALAVQVVFGAVSSLVPSCPCRRGRPCGLRFGPCDECVDGFRGGDRGAIV